jgi:hypothetical protein
MLNSDSLNKLIYTCEWMIARTRILLFLQLILTPIHKLQCTPSINYKAATIWSTHSHQMQSYQFYFQLINMTVWMLIHWLWYVSIHSAALLLWRLATSRIWGLIRIPVMKTKWRNRRSCLELQTHINPFYSSHLLSTLPKPSQYSQGLYSMNQSSLVELRHRCSHLKPCRRRKYLCLFHQTVWNKLKLLYSASRVCYSCCCLCML